MIVRPYHDNYHENSRRTGAMRDGHEPCTACGRAINVDQPHWRVYIHDGGDIIVTEAEYDEWETARSGAGLGTYPIGPDCLRKHSEVKPYAIRVIPQEPDGVTTVPGFGQIML